MTNTDKKYFEYLVELRDTGVTNMHAAGPYLASKFAISEEEANEILKRWIDSLN